MAEPQEYVNATQAFGMDPELRQLLMQTMAQASEMQLPAEAASPFRMPESAADQFRMTASLVPPPALSMAGQVPNRAAKMDKLPPPTAAMGAQTNMLPPPAGSPPPAPLGVPNYSPMQQFGPSAAVPTQQSAAAPNAGVRPPMGVPGGAPRPPAQASTGSPLGAFLRGLGSSNAILPAIGGAIGAVEAQEQGAQARSQTMRALMGRGLDADTAAAAASNPEILKVVLPGLFGGSAERKLGEAFDPETGQPYKFFYSEKGNANIERIGGGKKDATDNALTTAQGRANIKRVELMKNEANSARELLGSLGQLKAAREGIPDTLKGLPGGLGSTVAGWTDYFGVTDGARALNPQELNIQLGFTERTKGAITDREMGMFAGAVPGFGMTDAAAGKVIAGMEAAAQRKIEQAKFYEEWMARNKNSLQGAQDAWDAYRSANPIISRNPDGTLSVNTNNIGNWSDYVAGDGADPRATRGPATGDANIGMGSDAGGVEQPVAPPTVTSVEEYNALDPGTVYLDAQGNQRRKR